MKRLITLCSITLALSAFAGVTARYTFDGKRKTPAVIVKDNGLIAFCKANDRYIRKTQVIKDLAGHIDRKPVVLCAEEDIA